MKHLISGTAIGEIHEFVLPLCRDITLVYSKKAKERSVRKFFLYARNLATLVSAEQYVACADLDYLQKFIEMYKLLTADGAQLSRNATDFSSLLFWHLENPEQLDILIKNMP